MPDESCRYFIDVHEHEPELSPCFIPCGPADSAGHQLYLLVPVTNTVTVTITESA